MYTRVTTSYNTESYLEGIAATPTTYYRRWMVDGVPISDFIDSAYGVSAFQHVSIARHYLNVSKNDPHAPLVDSSEFSGELPEIPVHYFRGKYTEGSKNFKAECNSGLIVYHPYEIYTGVVRSGRQWTQINSTSSSFQPFIDSTLWGYWRSLGLLGDYRYNGNGRFALKIPGSESDLWAFNNHHGYITRTRKEDVLTVPPLNARVQSTFESNCISALQHLDDAIVTETLAKANDKEIDLLTTLAELPKTMQSILDGFRLIAKITKDAKRKEFELTESYERLKMNNARLADSKAANYKRNKKRKNKQDKTAHFDRWSKSNEQKFGSQTAVELLDAITGVWMNYRYNIRPIVFTIQDSVSVVEKWKNQYLTVRTVQTKDLNLEEIPGYTFTGTSKITHRCWIKRRYDTSDDWNNFTKLVMGDIFVTAYELIPVWSIVADWFFNIGPALRAASYAPVHTQQAATYSVKVEVKGSYYLNSDPSVFYDVEFTGYRRKSITPSQHISIRYVNEFDDLKGYDSLSFLWASIRKPVKNIPQPYRRG